MPLTSFLFVLLSMFEGCPVLGNVTLYMYTIQSTLICNKNHTDCILVFCFSLEVYCIVCLNGLVSCTVWKGGIHALYKTSFYFCNPSSVSLCSIGVLEECCFISLCAASTKYENLLDFFTVMPHFLNFIMAFMGVPL